MDIIKSGAIVQQVLPAPITGVVIERRLNDSHNQVEYLVESPDKDGDGAPELHWFLESQLKVVEVEPAGETGEGA